MYFPFFRRKIFLELKIYYWSDCQSVRRAFNTAGVEGWVGDFAFQTIIKSKTFKQSKKTKQKIQTNIKSRGWRILICQTIKEGKKTSEIEIWEDLFLSGMTSSYFKDLYATCWAVLSSAIIRIWLTPLLPSSAIVSIEKYVNSPKYHNILRLGLLQHFYSVSNHYIN